MVYDSGFLLDVFHRRDMSPLLAWLWPIMASGEDLPTIAAAGAVV